MKLMSNIVYPLKPSDELEFGDSKKYRYIIKMYTIDNCPPFKKFRNEPAGDEILMKQNSFIENQENQIKNMREQIALKQEQTEKLTAMLEELVTQQVAVREQSEEKNNQIKILEEQIKTSKDHQTQLLNNLSRLINTMEEERKRFEEQLNAERRKWQEVLDVTKIEQETFERNMTEQMNHWKQQQLAAVASEKELLEKQLKETQEALKEQAALNEQYKAQQGNSYFSHLN